MAVFEESDVSITIQAERDTHFVLGSAVKHPHDLVIGHYSVHTSSSALSQGASNIRRIGAELMRAGKLRGPDVDRLGPVAITDRRKHV